MGDFSVLKSAISRHGKAKTSFALLIWLNEIVHVLPLQRGGELENQLPTMIVFSSVTPK